MVPSRKQTCAQTAIHAKTCGDPAALAEIGYRIIPAYRYPPCPLLANEGGWRRDMGAEPKDLPWSKLQKAGDMTFRGAYSAVHRYCAPTTGVLQLGQQKSNIGMGESG